MGNRTEGGMLVSNSISPTSWNVPLYFNQIVCNFVLMDTRHISFRFYFEPVSQISQNYCRHHNISRFSQLADIITGKNHNFFKISKYWDIKILWYISKILLEIGKYWLSLEIFELFCWVWRAKAGDWEQGLFTVTFARKRARGREWNRISIIQNSLENFDFIEIRSSK